MKTTKNERLIRSMELRVAQTGEGGEQNYKVEGYASTFTPYVLFEAGGIQYKEVIDRHAFDDADMSDVVFRVDHKGPVYARSSAGTVELSVDDGGLHDVIDLGRTENSRKLFEDIAAGNYQQQSFEFIVAEDAYDRNTHTRKILRIKKLYDVSAVSFPANPATSLDVATRAFFDGEIEKEKAERLLREQRERQRQELELRIKILESES